MAAPYLSLIREFLAVRRLALIGASRDPRHFSMSLFREFRRRGYDVAPVNPHASEVDGERAVPRVRDVSPAPAAALIVVPRPAIAAALEDCAAAGVPLLWIWGTHGSRTVPADAIEFCERHGIRLIPGYCPFMFLPKTHWFHRGHGWVLKLTGAYPPESAAAVG